MEQSLLLSDQDPDIVGRRAVALTLLKRGTDREKIIERTGFTSSELFVIEQTYYDSRDVLDQRAQTIKQMDRLDALLDMAFDQVSKYGLMNEKGDFGANLTSFVTIIREISDLAGLKKQRVETEVRIIEEAQINIISSYVAQVLDAYTDKVLQYMTVEGRKLLDEKRSVLYAESVEQPSKLLEGTVSM